MIKEVRYCGSWHYILNVGPDYVTALVPYGSRQKLVFIYDDEINLMDDIRTAEPCLSRNCGSIREDDCRECELTKYHNTGL